MQAIMLVLIFNIKDTIMSNISSELKALLLAAFTANTDVKALAKENNAPYKEVKALYAEWQETAKSETNEGGIKMESTTTDLSGEVLQANTELAEGTVLPGVETTDEEQSELLAMLGATSHQPTESALPAVTVTGVSDEELPDMQALLEESAAMQQTAEAAKPQVRASKSTTFSIKPASSRDSQGKSLQRRNYTQETRQISIFWSEVGKLAHITTDVNFTNRTKEGALRMCHQVMGKQKTIMELCTPENKMDWVLLDEKLPFVVEGIPDGDYAKAGRLAVQEAFQKAGYRILGKMGTGAACVVAAPEQLFELFPQLRVTVAPVTEPVITDPVTELETQASEEVV
jgi:hypothetical protein